MSYSKVLAENMKALQEYQNNPYVHPFTCGRDSLHNNLRPIVKGNVLYLECPDCDYAKEADGSVLAIAQAYRMITPVPKTLTDTPCSWENEGGAR